MRIFILHDWEPSDFHIMTWADGLAAAIQALSGRGHEVTFHTMGLFYHVTHNPYFSVTVHGGTAGLIDAVKAFQPDVILHWADMTRPNAKPLSELGIPMAICFAGGEPLGENYPYFDHVFVESEVYKKVYEKNDIPVSIAFGTNTELFKPIEQNKLIDTIFPATFAYWKRHGLYADAVQGLQAVAVGQQQPSGIEEETWKDPLKKGVTLLPHATPDTLHYLYAASRVCVITSMSSGGSQRTVLEAMSMNLPLVITDSDKFDYAWESNEVFQVEPNKDAIRSIVDYILTNNVKVNTREYILENWSEYQYADALEAGLKAIVK